MNKFSHYSYFWQQHMGWMKFLTVVCMAMSCTHTHIAIASSEDANDLDEQRREARELFNIAYALHTDKKDCAQALEFYQKSRQRMRGSGNTLGAAICLDELHRFDESLDLYREIWRDFYDTLHDENKREIPKTLEKLANKTGKLEISTNAKTIIVTIDNARNVQVESNQPINLLPGSHILEVSADGYYSSSLSVEIKAANTESRSVQLKPVGARIRVDIANDSNTPVDPALLRHVRVLLNGARVGTVPWQGPVPPGTNTVQLEGEGIGSLPQRIEGIPETEQKTTLQVVPVGQADIGANLKNAELRLGDLQLGKGRWSGILPVGTHFITANVPGYYRATSSFEVRPDKPNQVRLFLRRNVDDPIWEEKPYFWIAGNGGLLLAPTLNSGPENNCALHCRDQSLAWGGLGALRGGVTWWRNWSFDIEAGGFRQSMRLSREDKQDFPAGMTTATAFYRFQDAIDLSGLYIGAGLSYRLLTRGKVDVVVRGGIDIANIYASDLVRGTISVGTNSTTAPLGEVRPDDHPRSEPDLIFSAEALARVKMGRWRFGFGPALVLFPKLIGDDLLFGNGELRNVHGAPRCEDPPGDSVFCAPANDILVGEKAYGSFVSFSPRLSLQYEFR